MASGSYTNGVGGGCALKISWSSSAGSGGSTVNASLIAQNQNGYYWYARVYAYGITINGSQSTGSNAALSSSVNGASTLISHSVWVGYTGNKSITISGYANFGSAGISGLSNQTISGTATLDKVGSAPTMGSITSPVTGTWAETTKNITVSWNAGSSYNNSGKYRVDVSVNGGAWSWVSGDLSWSTRSYTYSVTPPQGTTYQFRVSCGNDVGWSSHSYSGTVTINKINSPTIGTISTYNPYTTSSLTVPLSGGGQTMSGGTIYRMADLYYGDTKLASCATPSKNNTSATITYSAANYASQLGTKKYTDKFKIVAWVQNENGSKSSTVTTSFTVNINSDGNATPTLSAPTLSGGAFGNPSTCFIAGVSTLTVNVAAASLRRAPSGTTITYSVSCTGFKTSTGTTANFVGLTAGTKTITVTATDSRGLSTSVTKNCVVQSYAPPTVRTFTTNRLDSPNTSAKLEYTLSYSPIYQYTDVNTKGNQLNGISVQQYKKNNLDWATASNNLVLTNLSTDTVYTIALRISDKVKPTTYSTATRQVTTIEVGMAIRSTGVGIGCIPQSGNSLEVSGNTQLNSLLTVNGFSMFNKGISVRSGNSNYDAGMIGFGQEKSNIKYEFVFKKTGLLTLDVYPEPNGSIQNIITAMSVDMQGAITINTLHSKSFDVSGTIKAKNIQDYDDSPIKIGLLATSLSREWIGMYDVTTPSSRYFWMGRNKNTNKIFYFTGESTIDNFYFNKPISHTGNRYAYSEHWTGQYWVDGKKIYCQTLTGDGNNQANVTQYVNFNPTGGSIIEVKGMCYVGGDTRIIPLNFPDQNSNWSVYYLYETDNKRFAIYSPVRTLNKFWLTVYYTK